VIRFIRRSWQAGAGDPTLLERAPSGIGSLPGGSLAYPIPEVSTVGIITMARQAESHGEALAERVAEQLGYTLVDRAHLEQLIQSHGLTGRELDESDEEPAEPGGPADQVHVDYLQEVLLDLAVKEDLVVLGRGGQILFRDCPWALHVRIVASAAARRAALQARQPVTDTEADALLAEADRQRTEWIRRHYGVDWADPAQYDLIVRTDRLGVEDAAALIGLAAERRRIGGHLAEIGAWIEGGRVEGQPEQAAGTPAFVHPSEAELAKVLDFYRIRWEYEPTAFPLAWNEAGQPTEAFRPDFYLPDLDLYLELTTLRQSLVTDKNRKVRRFRELYPNVRLKVFYGRDFRSLIHKYGLSLAPTGSAPPPDRRERSS
jgi:cytidylate kinase